MNLANLFQSIRLRLEPVFRRVQVKAPRPTVCQPQAQATAPVVRLTAVELLRNEPDLTAAEVAERAGVSLSYATSLVRKQQRSRKAQKLQQSQANQKSQKNQKNHPPSKPAAPAGPVPVRAAATPAQAEAPSRVHMLELAQKGKTTAEIAESLNVAPGEVEFVVKIAKLRKVG